MKGWGLCRWGGRDSPRRATCFLLLRQKKAGKEKATLLWASLRFAQGNLRCSLFAGSAQTRFAQTGAALIREELRSSAPPEGRGSGRRFARPAPVSRATQVARSFAAGRAQWGRLSLAYFSLARQRKVSRPPRRVPAPALPKAKLPETA